MLTGAVLLVHPPLLVQDSATPCYQSWSHPPGCFGKIFRYGCVVCMRNAARRIPQIDDDPVIHTFPCWLAACLPYRRGRVLHTVAFARVMSSAEQAKGSIP